MPITLGGLASGIDTNSLINQLVSAASIPKQQLQTKKSEVEATKTSYSDLKAKIQSLQDVLETMDTTKEFQAAKGTSADEDKVTVSVTGDAVPGRYEVEVTQLAQAEMRLSGGYASKTTSGTIATGTLDITYGGTTTTITVDSSHTTLETFVSLLNEELDGVQAYIMDTGDAATPYRLVLAGLDTGADYSITLDTSGLDALTGDVPSFTTPVAAQDAVATVNGISVSSSTNSFSDVVEGVTFDLQGLTSSAVQVVVEVDQDGMKEKMNSLVDAYNAVVSFITTKSVVNRTADVIGSLSSERIPEYFLNLSSRLISNQYGASTDNIRSLAELGVQTQQSGKLEFDEDTFTAALEEHPDEVTRMFVTADWFQADFTDMLDSYLESSTGTLDTRIESLRKESVRLGDQIDQKQAYLDSYQTRLRAQFTAMEKAIASMQSAQSQLSALLSSNN